MANQQARPWRPAWLLGLGGLLLLATAWPAAAADAAGKPGASFVGKIVTSPMPLTPSGEEATFYAYLQEQQQSTFTRTGDGPWTIYLIGFFGQKIGATECHVALYRQVKGGAAKFVEAFGQQVTPDQDNLSARVDLPSDRVTPGGYELRITRLVRGQEKVYARTTITLK